MFESLRSYQTGVGARINPGYLADEQVLVTELARQAHCSAPQRARIESVATRLVEGVRRERAAQSGLDSFLTQYDLSSAEGVALMCLAEALLRVPDAVTADELIADRLAAGDWQRHLGASASLFVNASTWGLLLTGRLIQPSHAATDNPAGFIRVLLARLGEPVVRAAMAQAMQIMSRQFVMGRDIDAALGRAAADHHYSFDMLGEAALTSEDAGMFFDAYLESIRAIGASHGGVPDLMAASGVSVKLSALTPRLEFSQLSRLRREVVPRLTELVVAARHYGVPLTVDAEESWRLELSLAVFESVYTAAAVGAWQGFGLVVQAYQRRAMAVIEWLAALASTAGSRIPVRLVKGAYWDTEIKRAQEAGWSSYPVFTRKANTDISYLACARKLFATQGRLWPQFATHNAHTVAYVLEQAPEGAAFEFQRLHGMGAALYRQLAIDDDPVPCRIYAPVGKHDDLLPYLVRRLLENGANTSFVNRIVDEETSPAELVRHPQPPPGAPIANPNIPAPIDLFAPDRLNSAGFNLFDGAALAALSAELDAAIASPSSSSVRAQPIIDGKAAAGTGRPVWSPVHRDRQVGEVVFATADDIDRAITSAENSFVAWNATPVSERAAILRQVADLIEGDRANLVALCVAEAGKCIPDALGEVREAVDFLRYYAVEAEALMGEPRALAGPTGEDNVLVLGGRGVFVCISPWNFPFAIFIGQIAAALVTGNPVVAKPAEQTSLVASRAIELWRAAGLPPGVLQFLPGEGSTAGARAVAHPSIAGVVFTGSTETALAINRVLAARDGPIATLIAETGGQNVMIVDSTALAEQVVTDVVQSAFNSAGQRCSALRVLCVQDDIADHVLRLLAGSMAELTIGDPARLDTDVGPVIDDAARRTLLAYRQRILNAGTLIYECPLPDGLQAGCFVAPLAVEIAGIETLGREVFGPILHVVRYRAAELEDIVAAVGRTGYGLTFGVQTRIEGRSRAIAARVSAGNVYVNRNMVGAVVGVQPFGGQGLSGTGPKAGGPHYLTRFVSEKTITVNTAAVGGNATLLAQNDV